MSRKITCSGGKLPALQLSLEKRVCLRARGPILYTPNDIAAFVTEHYGCKPQEVMLALYFNTRNEVISVQEVSLGGISTAPVDPKVFFAGAMSSGTSAAVLVHTHPSGDPSPSAQDIELTRQFIEGARLLAFRILDHIIVARNGGFVSLRTHHESSHLRFADADVLPPPPPEPADEDGDEDDDSVAEAVRRFTCAE